MVESSDRDIQPEKLKKHFLFRMDQSNEQDRDFLFFPLLLGSKSFLWLNITSWHLSYVRRGFLQSVEIIFKRTLWPVAPFYLSYEFLNYRSLIIDQEQDRRYRLHVIGFSNCKED